MPLISLSDIVARDATAGNRLPDTLKLKLGLERLGYYEPDKRGFTPGADDGLWHGLTSYQRDHGLDVDGIALPNGPTVSALNDDLARTSAASLITGKFDTPLSSEAIASNQRTVRALQSFRGVGDLPTFAVSALRSGNPAAPAEVADLLARSQYDAPEQGKRLRDAFAEYLDNDDLTRLDNAVRVLAGGAGVDRQESPSAASQTGGNEMAHAGQDERVNGFIERLGPREGGFSDRKSDRGGRTYKGLSQSLLDAVIKQNPDWHLPNDPRDVSEGDRSKIFRTEAYDRLQIGKWAGISGLEEAAPKLAEQMFDAGITTNPTKPAQWLQQALDEHVGTDLKTSLKDGSIGYDGLIGPRTRDAIERAVRDGKIGEINNALAAKREAYVRTLPDFADNPGWIPRIRSFRQ